MSTTIEPYKEQRLYLANQVLNTPGLVNRIDDNTFFRFVMLISKYDTSQAIKIEKLKPIPIPKNKVLFWKAVGILTEEDC